MCLLCAASPPQIHLDGQGLSSRLDQLLPLGSLVFREQSECYMTMVVTQCLLGQSVAGWLSAGN